MIGTYARRMLIWADVARLIKGQSSGDRKTLRRALTRSPFDALKHIRVWRNPMVDRDCNVSSKLGRFHVRANSDDLYLTLPTREPGIVREMNNLSKSDVFVDAGANIGVYTVYGSKLAGQVIAIEMMPDTASILRKHITENGCRNVTVVEAALSDVEDQTVTATVTPGKFGQASIAVHQEGREVEVQTTTLAKVLADVPFVSLLKMDLEGAEPLAVKGLEPVLHKIGSVIFEDWGGGDVAEWFKQRGFDVTRIDGANSMATATERTFSQGTIIVDGEKHTVSFDLPVTEKAFIYSMLNKRSEVDPA